MFCFSGNNKQTYFPPPNRRSPHPKSPSADGDYSEAWQSLYHSLSPLPHYHLPLGLREERTLDIPVSFPIPLWPVGTIIWIQRPTEMEGGIQGTRTLICHFFAPTWCKTRPQFPQVAIKRSNRPSWYQALPPRKTLKGSFLLWPPKTGPERQVHQEGSTGCSELLRFGKLGFNGAALRCGLGPRGPNVGRTLPTSL